MQNGLTANQTKYTKNHGVYFWTNPFARRKVKKMKWDRRHNKPSVEPSRCAADLTVVGWALG